MRKVTLLAAGLAAAAGLLVPATAANAADSANTDVTFIIAGLDGNLSLTSGPLGTIVPGSGSATGTLPPVSVSDNRNSAPRGWVASVTSTDFVGDNQTISKSSVVYEATALAGKVGTGDLASTGPQSLDSAKTVVDRTGLTWPLEVITWTPRLTVNYADGAALGNYTGTITVSVA